MTILQSLAAYYGRLDEPPRFGYSQEGISHAVLLSPSGAVVDVQPLVLVRDGRSLPRRMPVPKLRTRTSAVAPHFLWDKTAYALGAARDASDQGWGPPKRHEFEAFKRLHSCMLAESDDAGLAALVTFLESWLPEDYGELPHAADMLDKNIVFGLDCEALEFLHDRPAARRIWASRCEVQGGDHGLCLVTGERGPIAPTHPVVKGVRGAKSSGAPIVSFNEAAFKSYGKEKGSNAPISEQAAFAYTTALNALLSHQSRQRVQIGDATTVFWAEAAEDEADARAAEDLFSILVASGPSDEQEAARVRDKLLAVAEGRPLADVAPDVHVDTRIFVLGLAPNAARLSVRFWHADSIGNLTNRLREHWQDLMVEPAPPAWPPAAWQVLRETAVQRESGKVPPTLGGALMRAVLTGGRYPRSLLAAVVGRVRADKDLNAMRAAICRAVLARECRLRPGKEGAPVTLHEQSNDIAYNLGRLFAAYAYAEKSLASRNATIRDKYVGAASATPLRVFPVLMRGYEHNRSALAKAGGLKAGSGVKADRAVGRIVDLLPPDLPRALGLEDQARFFVGYYHQEQAFYAKSDSERGRLQDAEGRTDS